MVADRGDQLVLGLHHRQLGRVADRLGTQPRTVLGGQQGGFDVLLETRAVELRVVACTGHGTRQPRGVAQQQLVADQVETGLQRGRGSHGRRHSGSGRHDTAAPGPAGRLRDRRPAREIAP